MSSQHVIYFTKRARIEKCESCYCFFVHDTLTLGKNDHTFMKILCIKIGCWLSLFKNYLECKSYDSYFYKDLFKTSIDCETKQPQRGSYEYCMISYSLKKIQKQ